MPGVSKTLRAEPVDGHWDLSVRDFTRTDDELRRCQANAIQRGREILRCIFKHLGSEAGVWQFELCKSALGDGELALGLAQQLAEKCSESPSESHEVHGLQRHFDRACLDHAFSDQALEMNSRPILNFAKGWRYSIAMVVGFLSFAWTALIYGDRNQKLKASQAKVFAVHGEWSNRTRHVLNLISNDDVPDCVIILGRPRLSLRSLRRLWEKQLGTTIPQMVRPFSLSSAIRSLSSAYKTLTVGRQITESFPVSISLRAQAAQIYRCLIGEASKFWWQRHEVGNGVVVYGHTGLADTTALGLAQQSAGLKTVHLFHGVSEGINFTGRSSSALCRCGHDMRWNDSLGHYDQCDFVSMSAQPERRNGPDGLVLFTNLAHPMNLGYQTRGIEDELSAIKIVANSARSVYEVNLALYWRPHPVIETLPSEQVQRLLQSANELGFEVLDRQQGLDSICKTVRWFVSTPSTVAIDLMTRGVQPVLLDIQGADRSAATMQLSTIASNQRELADLLTQMKSDQFVGHNFEKSWKAIEPGAMPGSCSEFIARV